MEHIMNYCQSLMDGVMFEKQKKLVYMSYHVGNVEGEGLMIKMPAPEGGLARTFMVTLPEEELAQLCEAEAISSLNPTMILSGKTNYIKFSIALKYIIFVRLYRLSELKIYQFYNSWLRAFHLTFFSSSTPPPPISS
ncbi:hypothetical protein ACFX15_010155 [Malus domestica]